MSAQCEFETCRREARRGGLCEGHYSQRYRGLALTPLRPKTPRHSIGPQLRWLMDRVDHVGVECLTWPFSTQRDGRGQVAVGDKTRQAHRVMCELKNGAPPTPEHEAAHSCGMGHLACVHPGHLTWKTSKENKADQVAHGTRVWGEKHPSAIVTEGEVLAIRYLADDRIPAPEIASIFHLKPAHVGKIIARTIWGHI